MTEYKASPAAVLGRAGDGVETVEKMARGGRWAVRGPRPTPCPACGGSAMGTCRPAPWPIPGWARRRSRSRGCPSAIDAWRAIT